MELRQGFRPCRTQISRYLILRSHLVGITILIMAVHFCIKNRVNEVSIYLLSYNHHLSKFCPSGNLLSPLPINFLRLHLSPLDNPYFVLDALQPYTQRRLLRNLQSAEPIKLDTFLLERFGCLGDFETKHLGTLLIATVVEGELLFEAVAFCGILVDSGVDGLKSGLVRSEPET